MVCERSGLRVAGNTTFSRNTAEHHGGRCSDPAVRLLVVVTVRHALMAVTVCVLSATV